MRAGELISAATKGELQRRDWWILDQEICKGVKPTRIQLYFLIIRFPTPRNPKQIKTEIPKPATQNPKTPVAPKAASSRSHCSMTALRLLASDGARSFSSLGGWLEGSGFRVQGFRVQGFFVRVHACDIKVTSAKQILSGFTIGFRV